MKNNIVLYSNLITNFKPIFFENFNDTIYLKKKNNQIFCKNFLFYIILLKHNKKLNFNLNISLHIKKNKNKVYTILRSPYRHKLARHQISFNRYKIKFIFNINIPNNIHLNNFNKLITFLNFLKKFNFIFETNLISLENFKFKFNFKFINNFLIKNY